MRRVFLSSFSLVIPFLVSQAWSAENSAHALAQKFAIEESKEAQPRPASPVKVAPAPTQAKATAQTPPRTAPAPSAQDDEREMLAAARAEAEARKTQETARPAAANPAPPPAAPPAQKPAPSSGAIKATVLVVLSQNGGHGTTFKTFDPIICFAGSCFISTGANSDARTTTRDDALSTKNAVTTGAGACAGQMGCVFRGVSFEQGAPLQIIDLGLVNHKLHEPLEAKADATCALSDGDLICKKPLTAPDYRVWIVPETVAAQAGPDKLGSALDDELPEENVTLETDK